MKKLLITGLVILLSACGTSSKMSIPDAKIGPDAIVYKTKADYYHFVPIALSEDGKTVLSFPHPKDLLTNGILAVPTRLKKGCLLDNRGIGTRVAFTRYTYPEYAALASAPSVDQLMNSILDANPIKEMYNCGQRSDILSIGELNSMIKNDFQGAKRVK